MRKTGEIRMKLDQLVTQSHLSPDALLMPPRNHVSNPQLLTPCPCTTVSSGMMARKVRTAAGKGPMDKNTA